MILEYNPNGATECVAFAGSHLDVVPANPGKSLLYLEVFTFSTCVHAFNKSCSCLSSLFPPLSLAFTTRMSAKLGIEDWQFDPFSLKRDGDKLYGRGTTDCLGHVAVLTELFRQLGTIKPDLKVAIYAVFIASEENSSVPEVGVDMLMKHGYLDRLKNGPVYWCAILHTKESYYD